MNGLVATLYKELTREGTREKALEILKNSSMASNSVDGLLFVAAQRNAELEVLNPELKKVPISREGTWFTIPEIFGLGLGYQESIIKQRILARPQSVESRPRGKTKTTEYLITFSNIKAVEPRDGIKSYFWNETLSKAEKAQTELDDLVSFLKALGIPNPMTIITGRIDEGPEADNEYHYEGA